MGSAISLVALVHIRCWALPRKPSFPITASTSWSQDRVLCLFSCWTLLIPFETGTLPQSSAPPGFDSLLHSFRVHSTPANMPWPPPDVLRGVYFRLKWLSEIKWEHEHCLDILKTVSLPINIHPCPPPTNTENVLDATSLGIVTRSPALSFIPVFESVYSHFFLLSFEPAPLRFQMSHRKDGTAHKRIRLSGPERTSEITVTTFPSPAITTIKRDIQMKQTPWSLKGSGNPCSMQRAAL